MINLKRMLEIQHQNNKNKKEILKKIKKIDKELNLERVFPVGYKDIEIISFEITGNDITGKKSLGIYYSAAIEDSYGVFDSIYSYATIDLDIFLLRDTEIEVLAREADQKKKLQDMLKAREKYEELSREIELKDLGVKYGEIEEYEKTIYTSSINHVVRLVRNDLVTRKATPLLSDLLKLKKVQEEWLDYFRYQLIAFYRKIAGFHPYIETISIDNNNIYFTDAVSGKEYFVPLELLSLPVEEAKEKYADILKNEKQILAEEKKEEIRIRY